MLGTPVSAYALA